MVFQGRESGKGLGKRGRNTGASPDDVGEIRKDLDSGQGRPFLRNQKILSEPRTLEKENEDQEVRRKREEAA